MSPARKPHTLPATHVGCAGWSIPTQHAHLFGPGDSQLARYATRFDVVEINSSFHRPHQRKTYERWAASVPSHFRFSVKLPKTISHEQRLQGSGPLLDRFVEESGGLGDKLAGVLVQLPPSLAFDARIAGTFFTMLRRRMDCEIACEPRHDSWFEDRVGPLWSRHGITRVAADPARIAAGRRVDGAGGWRYWRWHGSPRIYYSAYDDAALQALAVDVRAAPRNVARWVIFDNTAHGHAVGDGVRLRGVLGGI